MTVSRRRVAVVLVVILVLAAIFVVAASFFRCRLGGSPLGMVGGEATQQGEPGVQYTFGMEIPENRTDDDIRILAIDPIGVQGIELIGVTVTTSGPIGTALGYPPEGFTVAHPTQVTIPARSSPPELYALFGVRLPDGVRVGSIKGVRVRYVHDGCIHEQVFPWRLTLHLRDT